MRKEEEEKLGDCEERYKIGRGEETDKGKEKKEEEEVQGSDEEGVGD